MIPSLRKRFNAEWSETRYKRFLASLESEAGPVSFRISETPCFLDRDFLRRLAEDGKELIAQLTTPSYRQISEQAIPPEFRVPDEDAAPLFVQADFGLIRDETGALQPRLVEIQGFPSLYAFQLTLARAYCRAFELSEDVSHVLPPLDEAGYVSLFARAVLGRHGSENVVLLEIDPERQKTACDFRLTERMLGVRPVCITRVRKRGNRLYYDRGGVETPIHRIYNRAIIDEQLRRNVRPAFDWRDELDVEWAGHPNSYFRISKFSLPYLKHATIPRSMFLDRVDRLPEDLSKWVLKPLYSFAGIGVRIAPSVEEIAAIPAADRGGWILQERCDFVPVIETPYGPSKIEIRMMYIRDGAPRAVAALIRMGRGQQMGVDYNKDMPWTGASAGLACG